MKNYKKYVDNIKGTSYITDIPLKDFMNVSDIETFIKYMKRNGIGTVLHYETSNLYCGVVIQAYDIETCEAKEYLGGVK